MRAVEDPIGRGLVDAGRRREAACLVARELQLELPKLHQLVGRAQPGERKRRVGSRRKRDRPARAHAFDDPVEEPEEPGIIDPMHVVEDDDAVWNVARVERIDELGGDRALLVRGIAAYAAHQRFRRGEVDRHELELLHPHLPDWLGKVTLTDLRIGDASVDLLFHRWRGTTSAEVLRKVGDVAVTIRL